MGLKDKGVPVRLAWEHDDGLTEAVKDGALKLYLEKEYGPRSRERITFRASELADLLSVKDPKKGELVGCARKTFYSFFPDDYPSAEWTASAVMNFARGDEEELTMERYLKKAGLYRGGQTKLGAWGDPDDSNVPDYFRGDPRFPDRSGGLVRGKADFIIATKHGDVPMEMKTTSTYAFAMIKRDGPKLEAGGLQGLWYASEMDTTHFAVGYRCKESGEVRIFTLPRNDDVVAAIYKRAKWMKRLIKKRIRPPFPQGARGAEEADPPGTRFAGRRRMPDDAFFDRAWPCYTYGSKKDTQIACRFYEHCHGAKPERPKKPTMTKPAPKKGKSFKKADTK